MVWCPQYRRKVLTGAVELRLKELIQEAAAELNVDIIEMEIMPDHVHLLMEVDPQFGIHRAVKAIKGKISRVLRSEFASLRSVPLDEQLYFFWKTRGEATTHKPQNTASTLMILKLSRSFLMLLA